MNSLTNEVWHISTTEYYSAIKKNVLDTYKLDESPENYAE